MQSKPYQSSCQLSGLPFSTLVSLTQCASHLQGKLLPSAVNKVSGYATLFLLGVCMEHTYKYILLSNITIQTLPCRDHINDIYRLVLQNGWLVQSKIQSKLTKSILTSSPWLATQSMPCICEWVMCAIYSSTFYSAINSIHEGVEVRTAPRSHCWMLSKAEMGMF